MQHIKRYIEFNESFIKKLFGGIKQSLKSKDKPSLPFDIQAPMTLNPDKTYDVDGDVNFGGLNLKKLPIKFRKVSGNFDCGNNKLESLEGCPSEVGGHFSCSYNKLTSLDGCPSEVGGNFACNDNKLFNLKGCPSEIGKDFWCQYNELTDLDISSVIGGDLICYGNNIDPNNYSFYGEIGGRVILNRMSSKIG